LAPIIDAHCSIGEGRYVHLTAEMLLEQMDSAGVDRAVACPIHEHITVYNREGNDYILNAVRRYPQRLIGFATVNPWYGQPAVQELRRALGEGLRGLTLNSALQGYFIHDQLVYPLIEVAAEFKTPVYFHTATPIFALPFQLAELALVFPQVNFIMGHLAAADFWPDAVPAAKQCENIYMETSIRSGVATIRQAIQELGSRRVLFGSDAPESDIGVELAKIRLVGLAAEDEQQVLGGNMARLLGEAEDASQ
jgi:predicted TIM-barrel fold metal-dependent hydrolase